LSSKQADFAAVPSSHASKLRIRRAFLWLHRWLGLSVGAVLVLIGVTGSFNVFYRETDAILNPALYTPSGPDHRVNVSEVIRAAKAADPAAITTIIPPDRTWPVWIVIHAHPSDDIRHPVHWTTMIDPSTGALLGRRDYTHSLAFTIYRLHFSLLLAEWWGKEFVGIVSFLLLGSCLSGLYLWWPRPSRFLRSISLRKGVSPLRAWIDLHQAAGFWTLIPLVVIAVTGAGLVFPSVARSIVSLVSTATPYPSPAVAEPPTARIALPADQIADLAKAAKSRWDIALLNPPTEARNTWRVLVRPPGADPAVRSRGAIWLDPWTGDVVHDRTSDVMAMGDCYMTEQIWLHNGATFGRIGRLVVFSSGFVPLVLFITGFLVWQKKRRPRVMRPVQAVRQADTRTGKIST
jgi:uncharacterized iron-regulated membrane protein